MYRVCERIEGVEIATYVCVMRLVAKGGPLVCTRIERKLFFFGAFLCSKAILNIKQQKRYLLFFFCLILTLEYCFENYYFFIFVKLKRNHLLLVAPSGYFILICFVDNICEFFYTLFLLNYDFKFHRLYYSSKFVYHFSLVL